MERQLLNGLDAVEAALDSLSASIVAYNPSRASADGLITADYGLKQALSDLCVHQENTRSLSELRAEVEAIEAGNRMRLQGLANLYAYLGAARLSHATGSAVKVDELLNVAAATAKYAAPVGYKAPAFTGQFQNQSQDRSNLLPDQGQGQGQGQGQIANQPSPGAMSPAPVGLSTAVASPEAIEADTPTFTQPTQADSSFPPTQPFSDSQNNPENFTSQPPSNPGLSILSQLDLHQLNPVGAAPYFPWIGEDMIAKSHLAKSQGVDTAILERIERQEEQHVQGTAHSVTQQSTEALDASQPAVDLQSAEKRTQVETQSQRQGERNEGVSVFKWDEDE